MASSSSSSSSSSAIDYPKYNVFLSFRGADTRHNFTSHLYNALRKQGVNVFMDIWLPRGKEISSTLLKSIEGSKISIVIFSKNYASSKFCLEELVKILECRASRGQVVLPVFYKVDPFEVEKQSGRYGKAISSYEVESEEIAALTYGEETVSENKKKVSLWKAALAEAADLSGWDLHNRDEAEIIREIVEFVWQKLNRENLERRRSRGSILSDADQTGVEMIPEKKMEGKEFKENMELIWTWLNDDEISSIGIHGMAGAGKTALLIHLYNKLLSYGRVYWVTVSQDVNVHKMQNLIAKTMEVKFGDEEDEIGRAERLQKALLSDGKSVVILDDVWKHFEMKKVGIPIKNRGCKVIVSSRSLEVCMRMGLKIIRRIDPLF